VNRRTSAGWTPNYEANIDIPSPLPTTLFYATRRAQRQPTRPPATYALKRLRPQLCSDADKFTMGAKDLVHETAILARLDLCHIKLHGHAAGPLADAFASHGS